MQNLVLWQTYLHVYQSRIATTAADIRSSKPALGGSWVAMGVGASKNSGLHERVWRSRVAASWLTCRSRPSRLDDPALLKEFP